jgi:hypothetical protein
MYHHHTPPPPFNPHWNVCPYPPYSVIAALNRRMRAVNDRAKQLLRRKDWKHFFCMRLTENEVRQLVEVYNELEILKAQANQLSAQYPYM